MYSKSVKMSDQFVYDYHNTKSSINIYIAKFQWANFHIAVIWKWVLTWRQSTALICTIMYEMVKISHSLWTKLAVKWHGIHLLLLYQKRGTVIGWMWVM